MGLEVSSFWHAATGTWTHLIHAHAAREAAVIDPVLDFDPASGRVSAESAAALLRHLREGDLDLAWILETHAHADHLSAAGWLAERTGSRVGIGAGIVEVQRHFLARLGLAHEVAADGSQFDRLFRDGERFHLGPLSVEVMATPGHTSDSVSYRVGDAVFVGDTLFAPEAGSARCDFPGGDARVLYRSIRRLYELPDDTRVFLCHDYPCEGAQARAEVPVSEQRRCNRHLRADTGEAEFVDLRTRRDAGLAVPRLLWPALQVNLRGGRLPRANAEGGTFFRLPVDTTALDASAASR